MVGPSSFTSGSSPSPSREALATREAAPFAQEAAKEYAESHEKPTSTPGKVIAFLSESLTKLKEEGPWKMLLFWFEAGLDAMGLKKSLDRLVELTKGSWLGRLFDLGSTFERGLESIRSMTVEGVLQVALGGTLAAGTITALVTAFGDKVSLDEWLRAKDAPGGIAAFIVQKVQGGFELPAALWEEVRGSLGLPALTEVTQGIKEGWTTFDQASGLKDVRERMNGYLDQNYPGWQNSPTMTWVKDLSDPAKVAENLGIDFSNPATWGTFAQVGGAGLGLAGGYAVLRHYFSAGTAKGLTINAAIYMFFKSENVHTMLLMGIDKIRDLEVAACGAINEKVHDLLDPYFINPEDIGLHFEKGGTFGLADGMKYIEELSHENPALAMVAMDAAWLTRGTLVYILKTLFSFAAKSSIEIGRRLIDKPRAVAALVALGTIGVVKRREVVQDLADTFYTDEAAKQEFLTFAAKTLGIDFSFPETTAEKVADPLYERFIKDPLEFLSDGEMKIRLFKDLADGKIGFRLPANGVGFAIGLGLNMNPAWHAINLSMGAFESLMMEFSEKGHPDDDFDVWAVTALGAEAYVFGKMAIGTKKGYVSLMHGVQGRDRGWRFLKTFLPFTDSNWHLWFSAFREMGNSVPFINLTEMIQARRVAYSTSYAREILEAAQRGDAATVTDRVKLIRKELSKSFLNKGFEHLDDIHVNRLLDQIETLSADIEVKMLAGENATHVLARLERKIAEVETRLSRLLNIGMYIKEGSLVKAFREVASGVYVLPVDADALFKGKTEFQIRSKAGDLEREIALLADGHPDRAMKLRELDAVKAFLDARNPSLLHGVDLSRLGDSQKVAQLESMAANMESVEKGVSARVTHEIDAIVADANARGVALDSVEVQDKIKKIDEDVVQPFWKNKKTFLKTLNAEFSKLPKHVRTPHLVAQLQLAHENSYLTRVVKGAKGRGKVALVMLPLMFTMDYLLERNDAERDLATILSDFGPTGLQLLLDICPGAGTYSSFYSAWTGEQLVDKEHKLEGWEQASCWLWGTVGLAADGLTILTLIPSGSSSLAADGAARLALATARGSKVAARIERAWPALVAIAERLGGWEAFVQSVYRFMSGASTSSKLAKGLRTVEVGGLVVATAITVGGVSANLIYGVEDMDEGIGMSEDLAPQFWAASASDQDAPESIEEQAAAAA